MRFVVTLVSFALVSLFVPAKAANLTKKLLTGTDARCLDGSSFGFFHGAGFGDGANKFVIHLEGGGYCGSSTSCHQRAKTDLGSSTSWPATWTGEGALQSRDPTVNPIAYNWNFIYAPYCDGMVWTGNRTIATPETWNLYLSGHVNFVTMIDTLLASFGLGQATDVILKGSSAGGFGTFFNADYLAAMLPPTASLVAVPNAGFFISVPTYPGSGALPLANISRDLVEITASPLNAACVDANADQPWACLLPGFMAPFVKTPLFVVESETDTNQVFVQDGAPVEPLPFPPALSQYVTSFGQTMRARARAQITSKSQNGLFMVGCLEHVLDLHGPTISGSDAYAAFASWYTHNSSLPSVMVDECTTYQCGHNCPKPPHP